MSPRRTSGTSQLDEGYSSPDEEMAAPGVSSGDLTRRAELEQAAEQGEDIETLRRLLAKSSKDWTPEEREYNRRVMGVTYSERFGRPKHKKCINFCRAPGQRDLKRCPTCYGRAELRPMAEIPGDITPAIGRYARFWLWVGWVLGQVWLGITYPWRLDQARMRDLLEDLLADAVVDVTCPQCAAAEERQEA